MLRILNTNKVKKRKGLEGWLNKLKETLESHSLNAVDFVEDFKLNLYSKEIYVFTPKGDLKSLPKRCHCLRFCFYYSYRCWFKM